MHDLTERLRSRQEHEAPPVTLQEVMARSRERRARAERRAVRLLVLGLAMVAAAGILGARAAAFRSSELTEPAAPVTQLPAQPPVTTLPGCPQSPDHPAVAYIRQAELEAGGHWQVFWEDPSCTLTVYESSLSDMQKQRVRELAGVPVRFLPPGELPLTVDPRFRG